MVQKLQLILGILVCFGAVQSSALLSVSQTKTKQDKRAEQLETERKKLDKQKGPEDRAESFMKIADITLSYVPEAARANDESMMRLYLDQYDHAISDARNTMMGSGLDPYKKPQGYKTIELAIRKHLRILQDTARTLTLEERKPVQASIDAASKVRDEMLHALFR